jgi:uncharacterized membrane protein
MTLAKAITIFLLVGILAAGVQLLSEILLYGRPLGARRPSEATSDRQRDQESWTTEEIAKEGLGYAERSDTSYRHYNNKIRH